MQSLDWVLFDPQAHNFPMFPSGDTPVSFHRYMQYEPGNTRIVELNLETASVRLKSTPDVLAGKTVHYTKAGPKVVDVVLEQPSAPRGQLRQPSKRGGRGSLGLLQERKQVLGSSTMAGAGGVAKKEKRTIIKADPLSDGGSGSESPLSDFEDVMEVGDSQE
jgi:hypothetical protein